MKEPVGSPKRDSTIVPHFGLSLATVIHSLSCPFSCSKQDLREWSRRHGVRSAVVSLEVVVLNTMRQAFALEILILPLH
jgi:hypothetical protein